MKAVECVADGNTVVGIDEKGSEREIKRKARPFDGDLCCEGGLKSECEV